MGARQGRDAGSDLARCRRAVWGGALTRALIEHAVQTISGRPPSRRDRSTSPRCARTAVTVRSGVPSPMRPPPGGWGWRSDGSASDLEDHVGDIVSVADDVAMTSKTLDHGPSQPASSLGVLAVELAQENERPGLLAPPFGSLEGTRRTQAGSWSSRLRARLDDRWRERAPPSRPRPPR
jgi:hypothetical protein